MARIRSIKPEFFSNKALAGTSAHSRLLAIGLLTLADSEGRLLWIEMQVHAQVFPWERKVNTQTLLEELESIGYVKTYSHDGKTYVEVVNFLKHQRLTGKEAQIKSKLPAPNDFIDENDENTSESKVKHLDASQGSTQMPREQGNRGTGEQSSSTTQKAKKQTSIPDGVSEETWSDWMTVRKSKRAGVPTKTVLKRIESQAKNLGWSLGQAIDYAASQSWAGFESAWVKGVMTPCKPIDFSDPNWRDRRPA
jgi:hypothetical protein